MLARSTPHRAPAFGHGSCVVLTEERPGEAGEDMEQRMGQVDRYERPKETQTTKRSFKALVDDTKQSCPIGATARS